MDIYTHRAGRGLGPENTLEACALSLQFAVDFIDFDIAMTQDGYLVVIHDLVLNPDITRAPDGKFITEKFPICEMTYSELSTYNVGGINPSSIYASYFPAQRSFPFARIPLLKEAIEFVQKQAGPTMGFQIEIKTNPSNPHLSATPKKLGVTLAALLNETGIIQKTEVQSFDYRCLLELQQLNPLIKTSYLTHPTHFAGYDLQTFGGSYPRLIHALGGSCWGPFQMDLTQEALLEAQALGLKVIAWGYPEQEGTEFNTRQMQQLISWGIDGIITDRPDTLTYLLRRLA